MIVSKTITVNLTSKNIKHFESLGYDIPRYLNKSIYRMLVKRGTKIEVQVHHLPTHARTKVLYRCDECGKEKWLPIRSKPSGEYLCRKCSHNTPEYIQNHPTLGLSGKANPNWNDDLTTDERKHNIPGMKKWKTQVKQRDNYTCQRCGSEDNLHVHHIKSFKYFKESRTDIDNGITLCFDCHIAKNGLSIHSQFGNHPTETQFQLFMDT